MATLGEWIDINNAPLRIWGIAWKRGWRRPFPAMRTGDNGAVYVDTCEENAAGWETTAAYWHPALVLPEETATVGFIEGGSVAALKIAREAMEDAEINTFEVETAARLRIALVKIDEAEGGQP